MNKKSYFKVTTPVELYIQADTENEAVEAALDAILDLAGDYPVWAVITNENLTVANPSRVSEEESEDMKDWLARHEEGH